MKKFIKCTLIATAILIVWGSTFLVGVMTGIDGMEKRYRETGSLDIIFTYTGQEVLDSINQYRQEKELSKLEIDPDLCNNLIDRYLSLIGESSQTEGHPGFDAWATVKTEQQNFELVGEVWSPAPTLELVMRDWKGSPGHNAAITRPEYNRGCTYAGEHGVVLVMGQK